jgi:prophage regulatory protein
MRAATTKKPSPWARPFLGINAEFELESLLRLPDVLAIVPVSAAAWWKGIKDGRYPPGIKLGPKTTCWKRSDIAGLISGLTAAPSQPAIGTTGAHAQLTAANDAPHLAAAASRHRAASPRRTQGKAAQQTANKQEGA